MGVFKGKSQTSSSTCKKAGISQLLVAPYILFKKYSFTLHLTHLQFLSVRTEDLGMCCSLSFLCFKNSRQFTRNHREQFSMEVYRPFLSPGFSDIPELLEYSQTNSKQIL